MALPAAVGLDPTIPVYPRAVDTVTVTPSALELRSWLRSAGAARHHPGWHRPGRPQAHAATGARLAQTAANARAIDSNASQIAEEAST